MSRLISVLILLIGSALASSSVHHRQKRPRRRRRRRLDNLPLLVHRHQHATSTSTSTAVLLPIRGGDQPPGNSNLSTAASNAASSIISSSSSNNSPVQIASYAALAALTVGLVRRVPRSEGRAPAPIRRLVGPSQTAKTVVDVLFHIGYVVHALVVLQLLPESVKSLVFGAGSVVLLGTVFPMVESFRAVVVVDDSKKNEDTVWLQYWILHGVFSYGTEFLDAFAKRRFPGWFELEFYTILWLILPFTDGAALVYNNITRPYVVPLVQPVAQRCQGWLTTLALALVNASHLWFVGVVFMALPTALKRMAVIVTGTAYPVLDTVLALSMTTNEDDDDSGSSNKQRLLTYWVCFSLNYLGMHAVETFVGFNKVPGLYVLALAITLYLMLPIFNGSDAVFRTILVPLFGQREALLLKDARALARNMVRQLPAERHQQVRKAAAAAFLEEVIRKEQQPAP